MSLTSGLIPVTLQVLALAALAVGVGRRSQSWLLRWVTFAVLVGVGFAAVVRLLSKARAGLRGRLRAARCSGSP